MMWDIVEEYRQIEQRYAQAQDEYARLEEEYRRLGADDPVRAAEVYEQLGRKREENEQLYTQLTELRTRLAETKLAP